MSRLTKQTKFNYYYLKTTDGIHIDVLNDYGEVFIGTAVEKLAEYENLGSVEDLKQLSHELEVYKRAFINSVDYADETINKIYRADCCCSYEMESESYFLNQARKELEDERNRV